MARLGARTLLAGLVAGILMTAAATSASAYTVRGSVNQVDITGLAAKARVSLLRPNGKVFATRRADSLGALLFRNVPAGRGYRVRLAPHGAKSARITVHAAASKPWDPAIYHQSIPASGYTYLTTRDGTQLAIDVHPPMAPAGLPIGLPLPPGVSSRARARISAPGLPNTPPYPTLIEYSGYGYADPSGPVNGIAVLANLMSFDAVDTMNNLYAGSGLLPKYVIADIDTYQKGPEDDLYPNFPVNYLRMERVPAPDADWSPILQALRRGDFFVTTGEILIPKYSVSGGGARRSIEADVQWTFPLSFVEVVWGDGKKIDRQIISATGLPAFGSKHFSIPFDAAGKAWVRFAVWDSAGDGAFVQPVWLP